MVGCATAAQTIFNAKRGGALPAAGAGLMLLSMALLAGLLLWTRPRLPWTERAGGAAEAPGYRGRARFRMPYWVAAVGMSFAATTVGQRPRWGWPALALWLFSIGLLLAATRAGRPFHELWGWIRSHRWEAGAVLLCLGVALTVRTVRLATIPQIITGDEASIGLEARDILSGRTDPAFVTGWAGLPRLTFLLMALPMRLWGTGIVGLRMHAAIVGTATIITLYWLLRPETGAWLAQSAIWLLATDPFHLHISRLGVNQVDDSLLLTLTFAALFWGERSGHPWGWALAGLGASLSLTVYPGARVVIVLLMSYAVIAVLRGRAGWLREHCRGVVLAAASFLLVALPMLRFYLSHWNALNDRLNQVGIFQTGWLAREAQRTGRSPVALLWQQFQHTFFAYGFYVDTTQFFNDPAGLLQFWPAVLFPLGLAAALLEARHRLFLLLLLWFFSVIILGGVLTLSPPYTTRLTGLAPVLVTLVALAPITLARLGSRLQLWPARTGVAATALLVVALSLGGVWRYFAVYTPQGRFGDRNAELATAAGRYLQELGPAYYVYFLGRPRMFYQFSTIPFLAPDVPGTDAPEQLRGVPLGFEPNRPIVFMSIPEREAELRIIQQRLPYGKWIAFRRAIDGAPLFYAYQLAYP